MEIFSIGSFFMAAMGSIKLLDKLVSLCAKWYNALGGLTPYVTFAVLFIAIVVAVKLAGRLFRRLVNLTLLGGIDKVIGALLGIFKWSFFVSTFLWLGNLFHLGIPDTYTAYTFLFPFIESLTPQFIAWLSPWLPALQEWLKRISPSVGELAKL